MRSIRKPPPMQGHKIKSIEPKDNNCKPVIFSLEKIQPGEYCFSILDQENKAMFAEAIFKRKEMTWNDVRSAQRHGLGTEKIPKIAVTAATPRFITDDIDSYLVFRYHGKRAMVGYRQREIFYVLWFDSNFTLYKHS